MKYLLDSNVWILTLAASFGNDSAAAGGVRGRAFYAIVLAELHYGAARPACVGSLIS